MSDIIDIESIITFYENIASDYPAPLKEALEKAQSDPTTENIEAAVQIFKASDPIKELSLLFPNKSFEEEGEDV